MLKKYYSQYIQTEGGGRMKNFTNNSKDIINVVEEYNYDTQGEIYNMNFKRWRKNKQNPYAFNFEVNKKESVYIESKGFKAPNLEDAEAETLGKIARIIGIAMLIWISIDTVISQLGIQLFDYLGFNIFSTFFDAPLSGGSKEIVIALIITSFLKTIIPAIYLKKELRLPSDSRVMHTMIHPGDLVRSICLCLAVSTVVSLPNIYSDSTVQLFSYFSKLDADVSAWGQTEFVVYTIYDIIIMSIFSELLFRGAIFTALRQFGDRFAIGVTAVISGLLVQDFTEMPAVILISLVAGAGMVRSGSVYTAIFVQMIYKIYRLTLVIIETTLKRDVFLERNMFMLAVFVLSVVIIISMSLLRERIEYYSEYESEVPSYKRAFFLIKAYPLPVVAFICILAATLKAVF